MCVYFWVFSSIQLIHLSVFITMKANFYHSAVLLNVMDIDTPPQKFFYCSGSFYLSCCVCWGIYIKLRFFFQDLWNIVLESHWMCRLLFRKMDNFIMLILAIYEQLRFFHLLISSSVFVIQVFICLASGKWWSFILFVAIVKCSAFLTSSQPVYCFCRRGLLISNLLHI